MLLLFITVTLFVLYCTSESLANAPRHAGFKIKQFPLGLMLSNQVYSLNRFNGFLIAPLLGLYVDNGGGEESLKIFAIAGCTLSAVLLVAILKLWPLFIKLFTNILLGIERDGFSTRAFKSPFFSRGEIGYGFANRRIDLLTLFAQSFTTSLAMPTAFILNLLAIRLPEYQATLVQSATVISGMGNLVLNFYIFPKVALSETRGEPDGIYYSILLGKIFGTGVVSSCIIAVI
ncbi:DUF2837 family protein [Erythrobacter sp. NFXS35]|uniref:hypothetical protein n=1 Tax=Erythrobacter sp. NFXS35 TaxID=2818436 RepID=UPI0032DFAEC0